MAVKPDKNGKVTGTKNADKITFGTSSEWQKALTINAGAGADTIDFKKSKYKNKLYGEGGNDTINGGTVADMIRGGLGKDSIFGNGGADTIYGDAGDDYLNGGNGDDVLYGGDGTDTIMGADGNDSLYGDGGIDSIVGGNGDDYIEGGAGFGRLFGLTGNDTIKGGKDKDTIDGGDDKDVLYGGGDSDTIKGNKGNDILYGEDGNDYLYGMNDNDTLYGGAGNDLLDGGPGNDSLIGGDGNDTVRAGADNDYVDSGNGDDFIQGHGGKDTIKGGNGNDTIEGNDGDDEIYGDAGNDLLRGGNGNDTIYAGSGNDTINAGTGNDYIDGGEGNDTISTGAGKNTVISDFGNNYINIKEGSNTIIYKDTYRNSGRIDTIVNFKENDTLYFQNITNKNDLWYADYNEELDCLTIGSNEQNLRINILDYSNTLTDGNIKFGDNEAEKMSEFLIKNSIFTGREDIHMYDNGANVVEDLNISGKLYTRDGDDTITNVRYGNDKYLWIYSGNGNDSITGLGSYTYTHGGTGNDTIETGGFVKDAYYYGEEGNDVIKVTHGSSQNTWIYGGEGNDTIEGSSNVYGNEGDDNITILTASSSYRHTNVDGGSGNDCLIRGSENNDTIRYRFFASNPTGNDIIYDNLSGESSLGFSFEDEDENKAFIESLQYQKNGNDLIIKYKDTKTNSYENNSITLKDYLTSANKENMKLYISGSDIVYSTLESDIVKRGYIGEVITGTNEDERLTGTDYNDTIDGLAGNDTIEGGKGNDVLISTTGTNSFNFKDGDGKDVIKDIKTGDSLAFESILSSNLTFDKQGNDVKINYGTTDSVVLENMVGKTVDIWTEDKSLSVTYYESGAEIAGTDNSDIIIAQGNNTIKDNDGEDTIYLGSGNTTLTIDTTAMAENYEQNPNYVKTVYLSDDSVLTLEFTQELSNMGVEILCRNSGHDGDLIINLDNSAFNHQAVVIKDYFDENGEPKTNQVKFKVWEYAGTFDTTKVQNEYTVQEWCWAKGFPWFHTLDVQPFLDEEYSGTIAGTNLSECLTGTYKGQAEGRNGNDTFYARGGDDLIDTYGGDDTIYAGSGTTVIQGMHNAVIYPETAETVTVYVDDVHNLEYAQVGNDLQITRHAYTWVSDWNEETQEWENPSYRDKDFTTTVKNYYVGDTSSQLLFKIRGSQKNDSLTGSIGNDSFDLRQAWTNETGTGDDTIISSGGDDTIRFSREAEFDFDRNGDDLILKYTDYNYTNDMNAPKVNGSITFKDYADKATGELKGHSVNTLEIVPLIYGVDVDSSTYYKTLSEDFGLIFGTDGDDSITGIQMNDNNIVFTGSGNDTIDAGSGDDKIVIDGSGDKYFYRFIDNNRITIKELPTSLHMFFDLADTTNGYLDFIKSSDDDLTIIETYNNAQYSKLLIEGFFTAANTLAKENIKIYNSMLQLNSWNLEDYMYQYSKNHALTILGTEGDDTITSTVGNDIMYGYEGANTYVYTSGEGSDVIYTVSGQDTIQLTNLAISELTFTKANGNNDLLIKKDDNTILTVKDYVNADNAQNLMIQGTDETINALSGLEDYGIYYLTGGAAIDGGNNDEAFFAISGNNTIRGGQGNDKLYSVDGENRFVFNSGDGNDTLYYQGGEVQFEFSDVANIGMLYSYNETTGEYAYDQNGNDLIVTYDDEGSTLTIKDYYSGSFPDSYIAAAYGGASTSFAFKKIIYTENKTSYSVSRSDTSDYEIRGGESLMTLRTRSGSDRIYMTSSSATVAYAGAGDDAINCIGEGSYVVYAEAGNDDIMAYDGTGDCTLVGGEGSDYIQGGTGDDWLYTHNEDFDALDTLSTTYDVIDGGEGDDVIIATSYQNDLFGGEGNDTYLVYSTLSTYIVDHGTSTEDMLSIYDETYDNLHFVFNVDSTGAIDGNTMKVLNNANFELWQADMLDDSIKGITISRDDLGGSWNAIENFEDAGLGDECRSITINAIDTMRADIASWLAEEGYMDVADVFGNEKTEGDIDTLIAMFDITDQWHQEY